MASNKHKTSLSTSKLSKPFETLLLTVAPSKVNPCRRRVEIGTPDPFFAKKAVLRHESA